MDMSGLGALIALFFHVLLSIIVAPFLIAIADSLPDSWKKKLQILQPLTCRQVLLLAILLFLIFRLFYKPLLI